MKETSLMLEVHSLTDLFPSTKPGTDYQVRMSRLAKWSFENWGSRQKNSFKSGLERYWIAPPF